MKKKINTNKLILGVAFVTILVLLIPLIAMQFTDEVIWTLSDFIFAGILLFAAGASFVLVLTKNSGNMYKVGMSIAIVSTFLLIWVNLAVGLIGNEENSLNLMYFGVVVIGLVGAFISRFQPKGMSFTLFCMAASIAAIVVIALITNTQNYSGSSVLEILAVNTFFAVPFVISAISFRNAERNFQQG